MSSPAIIAEPTARKISPALFILVLLCFLLPFAGVSCNTSAASAFGAGTGTGGDCLNALNGKALTTYTGLSLVTGSDPSVISQSDMPAACNQTSSSSSSSSGSPDQLKVNVGVQPLAIVAIVAILAALLLSALKLPMRGLITAALAAVAAILLFVEQGRLSSSILSQMTDTINKAMDSSGGSSPGLGSQGMSASGFFNVNAGIGYIAMLVILGLVILYNGASFLMSRDSGAGMATAAPSGMAAPPMSAPPMATPPPPPPPAAAAPPPPPPTTE